MKQYLVKANTKQFRSIRARFQACRFVTAILKLQGHGVRYLLFASVVFFFFFFKLFIRTYYEHTTHTTTKAERMFFFCFFFSLSHTQPTHTQTAARTQRTRAGYRPCLGVGGTRVSMRKNGWRPWPSRAVGRLKLRTFNKSLFNK